MPHFGAPKARGLTAKARTERSSVIAAMRVVFGHCPRDRVPDFTHKQRAHAPRHKWMLSHGAPADPSDPWNSHAAPVSPRQKSQFAAHGLPGRQRRSLSISIKQQLTPTLGRAEAIKFLQRFSGPPTQAVGKIWLASTAIPTPQIAAPMRRGVSAIPKAPCRRTTAAVAVTSSV